MAARVRQKGFMSPRTLLVPLSALALALLACDGDNGTVGESDTIEDSVEDSVADTTPTDTGSPVDTTPIDTALPPIDVVQQNKDLRNGTRARIGHVIDGDTVHVWVGTSAPKNYTIRLLGLAAPECKKDYRQTPDGSKLVCTSDDELYGLKSYELMRDMVENKTVTITCDVPNGEWCKTDDFDRYLAYLVMDDGKDASVELARQGGAFSYTSFASNKRAQICRAEYEAQGYINGDPTKAQSNPKKGMWTLGTLSQILAGMNASTRSWYQQHHDSRCKAAM